MAMSVKHKIKISALHMAMVMSLFVWKILEWHQKPHTVQEANGPIHWPEEKFKNVFIQF